MRYRKRRFWLIKQEHLRIIIGIAIVLAVVAIVFFILSITGHQASKQNAVDNVAATGLINVGLRGDLNKLCTYNEDTGAFEGFEKDVADEIIRRLFGDEILTNYTNVNTETRTAYLSRDDIDFALGAATYIDQSGVDYSSVYFSDGSAFLVMEDKIKSMQELSGGIIGIVQGSMHAQEGDTKKDENATQMSDYLKKLEIEASVKIYASYPEAIDALRDGFVNAVCASETALTQFGRPGMLMLPERFMPNDYRVCISDSLGLFTEAVDDAIAAMKSDGTLESLMGKWNLVNYSELEEK